MARNVRLAMMCTLVGSLMLACSSTPDGVVTVRRPGAFEVELPGGWQVVLPQPGDDARVPVFSAGPGEGGEKWATVLFFDQGDSLDEKAEEWRGHLAIELGAFARTTEAGRETLVASGSGPNPSSGEVETAVVSVMRSSARPRDIWVFACMGPDARRARCERILDGFELLP
jgi:hypothetical protein